jgi:hypothetical protein
MDGHRCSHLTAADRWETSTHLKAWPNLGR